MAKGTNQPARRTRLPTSASLLTINKTKKKEAQSLTLKSLGAQISQLEVRISQLERLFLKHDQSLDFEQLEMKDISSRTCTPSLAHTINQLQEHSDSMISTVPIKSPLDTTQPMTAIPPVDERSDKRFIHRGRTDTERENEMEDAPVFYLDGFIPEYGQGQVHLTSDTQSNDKDDLDHKYGFISVPADVEDISVPQSPPETIIATVPTSCISAEMAQNFQSAAGLNWNWDMVSVAQLSGISQRTEEGDISANTSSWSEKATRW